MLRSAPEARDPDELRGLLRLASASESMCDAARDMTWYVEHGEPLHPVVQMALEETEETSAETMVEAGLAGRRQIPAELRVETETGMFVLAVQRGARWSYRPRGRFSSGPATALIAVGPEDGVASSRRSATCPRRAALEDDERHAGVSVADASLHAVRVPP